MNTVCDNTIENLYKIDKISSTRYILEAVNIKHKYVSAGACNYYNEQRFGMDNCGIEAIHECTKYYAAVAWFFSDRNNDIIQRKRSGCVLHSSNTARESFSSSGIIFIMDGKMFCIFQTYKLNRFLRKVSLHSSVTAKEDVLAYRYAHACRILVSVHSVLMVMARMLRIYISQIHANTLL